MKAKDTNAQTPMSVNKLMINAKVCRKTLEARLAAGWPTDYAVNLPAYTVLLNNKPVAMSDLAKECGITRRKLADELNGALHADEVVSRLASEYVGKQKQGHHTPRPRKAIEYQGRTWTIAELARHAGIKYITMSMRLRKGWPVEKAVGAPLREWPRYVYKGRKLTVAEIADETGVDRGLLSARIARGLDVDEAVNMSTGEDTKTEQTRTTRVVQDENGEWVTVGELARRAGLSYAVLTRRLFRDKLPLAKAISMPERKRTTYIVDGKKVSVAEVAKRINHCTGTVYLHLREGLTMQEIVDKYTKLQQESAAE